MNIGMVVRLVRIADGMPQAELAEALQVSQSYLAQVERGRRQASLGFLRKVAHEFQVPLPVLVLGEEIHCRHDELFGLLREILSKLLAARTKDKKDNVAKAAAPASVPPSRSGGARRGKRGQNFRATATREPGRARHIHA